MVIEEILTSKQQLGAVRVTGEPVPELLGPSP